VIIEILAFIFVLGLLVFVHELGHFILAKLSGIRVETFSLGFPPKMIGFRKGDTDYCISWVPLGGYVKMAGENPNEAEVKGASDEFMSKPIWKRSLVVFAGPAMNYVLAFFILFGIFYYRGEPVADDTKAVIGTVLPDNPAAAAGLQAKDVMIAVDDSSVTSFQQMYDIISKKPGQSVRLSWLRGNDTMSAFLHTRSDTTMNEKGEVLVLGKIGVGIEVEYKPLSLGAAISAGFDGANYYSLMIFKFLKDLISGSVSTKLLGGPIFIAQMAGSAAREGLISLWLLAAVLSVNLSIVNLMPIPVLDGGQLLFLLIEKIKGSPVSMKARAVSQQIGFAFLILLIIFVTKNDIWRVNLFGWK
jgi:regulator of sigma E protease